MAVALRHLVRRLVRLYFADWQATACSQTFRLQVVVVVVAVAGHSLPGLDVPCWRSSHRRQHQPQSAQVSAAAASTTVMQLCRLQRTLDSNMHHWHHQCFCSLTTHTPKVLVSWSQFSKCVGFSMENMIPLTLLWSGFLLITKLPVFAYVHRCKNVWEKKLMLKRGK